LISTEEGVMRRNVMLISMIKANDFDKVFDF